MDPGIEIRAETVADYPRVFDLLTVAFGRKNEAQLVRDLRDGPAFTPELSLVAECAGEVVGYILFSRITIAGDNQGAYLSVGPLAVRPELQRVGIGSRLMRFGIQKASDLGFDAIVVLGPNEYYSKFGFKPASDWNITTGYNDPGSTLALELRSGALANASGLVEYPEAFKSNNC